MHISYLPSGAADCAGGVKVHHLQRAIGARKLVQVGRKRRAIVVAEVGPANLWESVGECGRVCEGVGECGRVWGRVGECVTVWECVLGGESEGGAVFYRCLFALSFPVLSHFLNTECEDRDRERGGIEIECVCVWQGRERGESLLFDCLFSVFFPAQSLFDFRV